MTRSTDGPWDPAIVDLPLSPWRDRFLWVEEIQASPAGDAAAAVVRLGEEGFSVCVNGEPWPEPFEKIWHLRYAPDGRLVALASREGEWTVVVDGVPWENRFSFVWSPLFSRDGSRIAVAFQRDMAYGMAVDDVPWEETFPNLTCPLLRADGAATAAVVQTEPLSEGDIVKYREGIYTAAVDGRPWERRFMNVWGLACGADGGGRLAAEVRLSPTEYTIAVDGTPWGETFACVWTPLVHPVRGTVLAPVRREGRWWLAEDGRILWDRPFVQLWQTQVSPDGRHIAAVVAPAFGRWTVAVDGRPWKATAGEMASDPCFSPAGGRLAVRFKDRGRWTIAVDGRVWRQARQMVFTPVFSPDGGRLCVRFKEQGRFGYLLDDRPWELGAEAAWDPVFSPAGDRLLLRTVEGGLFRRRVLPLEDFGKV